MEPARDSALDAAFAVNSLVMNGGLDHAFELVGDTFVQAVEGFQIAGRDDIADNCKAALAAANGDQRFIPDEIFRALGQVANALANGNGVTVAPDGMLLTTQEAADFLGVSRPTLVKLLESGIIAHEKRGRHRRVTLRDLVEYQRQFRVERRAKLTDLARDGQRSGIILLDPLTIKRVAES